MLVQVNINQDTENNILYSKSVANLLSSAVIKNALGEDITIAWNVEETDNTIQTVMNELEKTANVCMDKNIFEDREDIEDINKIKEAKKVFINIEKVEKASNREQGTNVLYSNKVNSNVEGSSIGNSTQNNLDKKNNKTTNSSTNNTVTPTKNLEEHIKTYYGISTTEAFNIQMSIGGKIYKNGQWVSATNSEVQRYFMPSEENIKQYKFQFLNLASLAGISEAEAKGYLEDKGILSGKEATFIEAAKANNINEIYLMAHACLETGNGTSQLARGVNYKGTTVYNMFGIGAVDSNPVGKGAEYAYNMGWTSPEKAIIGGAEFISQKYINNYPYNQDTLYEMRWNPASPGYHQYATDIAWATKQAAWMEKIYDSFESATLTFDIPVYRK